MLNKKKPFGEVHGQAAYAFTQDDKFFNAQGVEVTESGKVIEEKKPEKPATKPVNVGTKGHVDHAKETEEPEKGQGTDPREEKTKEIELMTVDAIKLKLAQYDVKPDKKAVKADLIAMLVDEELAD